MNRSFIVILLASLLILGCTQKNNTKQEAEHVRHIELEGEPNFRDLGGYETTDGKTIKWGEIYRSGKFSKLTEKDVEILDSLKIKTVVNFLTPQEIEHDGSDKLPASTRQVSQAVDVGGDWAIAVMEARKSGDFSKVSPDLNPEFHRMLTNEAQDQYSALYKEIINEENRPLVFHCSHGIHRTGTATAILLWYLGVPWETVREDYLLSNEYRAEGVIIRLQQLQELAAKNQDIPVDEVDMTNVMAFYILEGHYIDAVKETIEKEYGSIDRYMSNGLGLSDSELKQLKEQLLETL